MCKTFYMLGSTCTGKDYLIELACRKYPHLFGAVQVGKALRAKYPPEYFMGSGAPDHTQKEALEIFTQQWNLAKQDKKYILVSSQPRHPLQVEPCFSTVINGEGKNVIVLMHTPHDIVLERLGKRFANDGEGYKLATQRVVSDKIMFYDAIFEILRLKEVFNVEIKTLDTAERNIEEVIDQIAHFGDF